MKVKRFWNERWVQIAYPKPTKKCDYWISDFGRVMSIEKETGNERLLRGTKNRLGDKLLHIKLADGSPSRYYFHRLVATYFVERLSEDHAFVIHMDEDNSNNSYKNLKWMTRKEMAKIQQERGHFKILDPAVRKPKKMTESKVRLLKQRLRKGKTKRKILAKQFNISEMQVSRISTGENWGHIE